MKLLYKEWVLAAHPSLYIFTALGCLVLVPAYPYTVIFMFGCLAPYISLMYARENNDIWFTALLPVEKRMTVKGKCLLILSAQLGQLVVSVPFALLRRALGIPQNPVGIDATLAWYGFGLMIFTLFDLVFLPSYFKTAYKAGKAFTLGMLPVVPAMVLVEILPHLPGLQWLDSLSAESMLRQLPVLALGAVGYGAGMWAAYRLSVRRFEKVDL